VIASVVNIDILQAVSPFLLNLRMITLLVYILMFQGVVRPEMKKLKRYIKENLEDLLITSVHSVFQNEMKYYLKNSIDEVCAVSFHFIFQL